jgi:hypothetical protein
LLPGRSGSSNSYRYGFQGQEKDDELKGSGNSLNYTFRLHDPRVGRFFALDTLAPKYPFYSPCQFSGNLVIDMVELEGLEPAKTEVKQKTTVDSDDPSGNVLSKFRDKTSKWSEENIRVRLSTFIKEYVTKPMVKLTQPIRNATSLEPERLKIYFRTRQQTKVKTTT